jgi:ribulose-phosphate 3-epimerase
MTLKTTKVTLIPTIKIAPSILAGDFGSLALEAKRVEDSGADYLHIDVMDGHFARNLTFGPKAVAAIKRATSSIVLDVHLMIYNPFDFVEQFVEAGANMITFHIEATEDVDDLLKYIRKCNVKAGLALSPETSPSLLINYLDKCDMVLLMTVNPGFGGQEFIPEMLDKIEFVRQACDQLKIPMDIEVDGGINQLTAERCYRAGANVFVSGSYIFSHPGKDGSLTQVISELRTVNTRK